MTHEIWVELEIKNFDKEDLWGTLMITKELEKFKQGTLQVNLLFSYWCCIDEEINDGSSMTCKDSKHTSPWHFCSGQFVSMIGIYYCVL